MFLRSLITALALLGPAVANASVVVNFWEDGGNVYSMHAGTVDLTALSLFSDQSDGGIIAINGSGGYHAALGAVDRYETIEYDTGQTWTTSTGFQFADAQTPNTTNLAFAAFGFFDGVLVVDEGYTSGDYFEGGLVWENESLASLGLISGTYDDLFYWGDQDQGTYDSISFRIGIAPIPVPASALLLGTAMGGLFLRRRKAA